MKVGDLVNFRSGVFSWEDQYSSRNPGLVISAKNKKRTTGLVKMSVTVLWADSTITSEHAGYLERV